LSIYDEGDPGLAWDEENAANDDGQAVIDAERAAEEARQAEADKAVRRLDAEVDAAAKAAYAARCTLDDLCGRLYDVELAESTRAGVIAESLRQALTALGDARKETAGRLKEITDAERDAELAELRAENARLRAALEVPGAAR
jgi:hypothetical protein